MYIDFFKDDSEFRICEINDPFHTTIHLAKVYSFVKYPCISPNWCFGAKVILMLTLFRTFEAFSEYVTLMHILKFNQANLGK